MVIFFEESIFLKNSQKSIPGRLGTVQTIGIDYYGAPGFPGVPWDILPPPRADAEAPPTPSKPTRTEAEVLSQAAKSLENHDLLGKSCFS